MADVNKSSAKVISISEKIKSKQWDWKAVFEDVELGTKNLLKLANASDSKQLTADKRRNTRHYSNVMFNIMRGGIFDNNYAIEKKISCITFPKQIERFMIEKRIEILSKLPKTFEQKHLKDSFEK